MINEETLKAFAEQRKQSAIDYVNGLAYERYLINKRHKEIWNLAKA